MREYGQVQSAFWQSKDAEAFSDGAKLLAVYLLTCPHANGLGCYRLPDGYVSGDLGWDSETVSERFRELFDKGFAYRFDGVVFLPNFLRWNKINNANIATARFSEWDVLPKGEAKTRAARVMLEFCNHWVDSQKRALETVTQTITQTVTQPEPNPTQPNPTQSQPGKNPKTLGHRPDDRDWFESKFWPAYPRKVAKASAAKAFAKINPDDALLERMFAALAVHVASEQWRRDDGRFIPHPATWLNQRRWEDDAEPAAPFDPASCADGAVL